MLTFYDAPISGNTYKVRLLLGQLAIPHEVVRLDIAGGAVRAKDFRKVNPFGRVPFIVEDGFALAESNAILLYLARGSKLLPADVRVQGLVQQWMFFEQNQVETAIGLPRLWRKFGAEQDPALLEHYRPRAVAALKVLERHLARRDWFVGDAYSVADIALFAYSQMAPEAARNRGGFRSNDSPSLARIPWWTVYRRATSGRRRTTRIVRALDLTGPDERACAAGDPVVGHARLTGSARLIRAVGMEACRRRSTATAQSGEEEDRPGTPNVQWPSATRCHCAARCVRRSTRTRPGISLERITPFHCSTSPRALKFASSAQSEGFPLENDGIAQAVAVSSR